MDDGRRTVDDGVRASVTGSVPRRCPRDGDEELRAQANGRRAAAARTHAQAQNRRTGRPKPREWTSPPRSAERNVAVPASQKRPGSEQLSNQGGSARSGSALGSGHASRAVPVNDREDISCSNRRGRQHQ